MKMTDHQRATVLKAQNEALTEKQMITSVRNVLEEIADEMEKGDLVADL